MPIKRQKHIEHEIEDEFVLYANTKDVSAVKFKDPGDTGAPDRICLCDGSHVFFIEFKKPGEVLKAKQVQYHRKLTSRGFKVYTVDNLDDAIHALTEELTNVR